MNRKHDVPQAASIDHLVDVFGAISDKVRLRILRILEGEELTVGELARVLQIPQSTASRHLKVLSAAGWLASRAARTATIYRLVLDDASGEARTIWRAVRDQIAGTAEAEEDARRLRAVLAERSTDSLSFFGRVAGEWDAMRVELFGTRFTAQGLLTLIPGTWTVADIGCGTGNVAALIAPHARRVVAIDQSGPMLEAAQRRLGPEGMGLANVEFVQASVEALPLADGSVDAAVCSLVLHHVDEPARALSEIRRVLRPSAAGGLVLLLDMAEHRREEYRQTMGHRHLGFSRGAVAEMLEEAGLTPLKHVFLPGDPEARGPGLFAATARVVEAPAAGS